MKRLVVMLGFLGVAALGSTASLAAQDVGLAVGTVAPAVTIEDLDGNPVDLGQWVGRKAVVLEFWATWCPLCAELEPKLEAVKRTHGDAVEVLFVAVAVNQNQRRIQRHLERHAMPGPILWDTQGRATRAFQAPSTSYIVVLDPAGKVVYTGIGENQDIEGAVARAVQ